MINNNYQISIITNTKSQMKKNNKEVKGRKSAAFLDEEGRKVGFYSSLPYFILLSLKLKNREKRTKRRDRNIKEEQKKKKSNSQISIITNTKSQIKKNKGSQRTRINFIFGRRRKKSRLLFVFTTFYSSLVRFSLKLKSREKGRKRQGQEKKN